jgi:glycosyltransferase involved in cell wall biosynthesis
MFFSIIIPAKNEEEYIGDTLQKLCEQRSRYSIPLEIIVVDGGSQDSTVNIASLYADAVLTDVDASRSIAHGRNIGAAHATGTVLIHTDADVDFPRLDILIKDIEHLFSDGSYVAATARLKPKPNEATLLDLFMHLIFNAAIKYSIFFGAFLAKGELQIARASTFEKVGGYSQDIIVGEDCELFFRLNKIGMIKYFDQHLVYHSTRRFKKYGYLKTLLIYGREGFYLLFAKKNYLKRWEEVR